MLRERFLLKPPKSVAARGMSKGQTREACRVRPSDGMASLGRDGGFLLLSRSFSADTALIFFALARTRCLFTRRSVRPDQPEHIESLGGPAVLVTLVFLLFTYSKVQLVIHFSSLTVILVMRLFTLLRNLHSMLDYFNAK